MEGLFFCEPQVTIYQLRQCSVPDHLNCLEYHCGCRKSCIIGTVSVIDEI